MLTNLFGFGMRVDWGGLEVQPPIYDIAIPPMSAADVLIYWAAALGMDVRVDEGGVVFAPTDRMFPDK